jgi:hypothetical protein
MELRECPDFAVAHLLESATSYLATLLATVRFPWAPIPRHFDPRDDWQDFEELNSLGESRSERIARYERERVWAPYAWP